jgi:hypothetical protein
MPKDFIYVQDRGNAIELDQTAPLTHLNIDYPFPRFRALALLGRRLPERMDGIFIPASEKPAQ